MFLAPSRQFSAQGGKFLPVLVFALIIAGCSTERDEARARLKPEYDKTGKLQLLKYDSKGDGKIDTWTYMDGARVVRIEIDQDGDGKIDRWEYYSEDRKLEKVGFSRQHDGVEDAWSFANSNGTLARIEVSTHGDGKIDRVEYFELDSLVRVEEDTDGDGRIDRWETYDQGRLASVAFDLSHRGKPERRLTYNTDGTAVAEIDREGNGHFVLADESPTTPAASKASRSQGAK